jgi:nitrite reductase (NO-forming)
MYHCGTAPALHHIGNGMHGMIVIDPPELAPVEEEFFLVQSELYLGPEGQPGDLGKMMNDAWDAVVFNGYHNQYLHSPIPVETDTRYRVYVMNNGPSENSAFHIVGTVFDTVFKEGTYLLQPDERRGGARCSTCNRPREVSWSSRSPVDGLYPIVTHKFSNVGKGALGLFAAGDVGDAGPGPLRPGPSRVAHGKGRPFLRRTCPCADALRMQANHDQTRTSPTSPRPSGRRASAWARA